MDIAESKCKQLGDIIVTLWNTTDATTKQQLNRQFKSIWLDLQKAGYKINRRYAKDYVNGHMCRVPKYYASKSKDDAFEYNDNRAEVGNHKGDCTTRAISFCTGVDYGVIQAEQMKNAKQTYGKSWRCESIWSKSLVNRGFCKVFLPKKTTGKVFLRKFKDAGIDTGIVAALSSHHLAAIDMAKKKILDVWNSENCRIIALYVPNSQKYMWQGKLNSRLG